MSRHGNASLFPPSSRATRAEQKDVIERDPDERDEPTVAEALHQADPETTPREPLEAWQEFEPHLIHRVRGRKQIEYDTQRVGDG